MNSLNAPALRGGLLALSAAALFGISTPLVQRAGVGLGAFTTAALLYGGAALVGALSRRPREPEARVHRGDFKRLLAMAAFGAVIGPVALAWGLQRTSGASASLMLTLEALFTAILAWKLYHETMDNRVGLGAARQQGGKGVANPGLGRPVPRHSCLEAVPRDHGQARWLGHGASSGRRGCTRSRPRLGGRCAVDGLVGYFAGHCRMGRGQHLVARTSRPRPGPSRHV